MTSESSVNQNMPSDICKVCGGEKPNNPNVSFCSACKKFFLRNRNKMAMTKCSTGLRNCPISWNNRRHCSYCRLAKCSAIGIRGRGRIRLSEINSPIDRSRSPLRTTAGDDQGSSSSGSGSSSEHLFSPDVTSSNSSEEQVISGKQLVKSSMVPNFTIVNNIRVTSTPPPPITFPLVKPPLLFDGSIAESTLRSVINSATELHAMDHTPMRNAGLEIPDNMTFWSMIMKQMNFGLNIGTCYSNCWLDVTDIDEGDLTSLVYASLIPLGASYMALPGNKGAAMYGINDSYISQFIACFPDLQDGNKVLNKLAAVMSEWNPSFVEASFLLAYLFFNDKIPLKCPEKVTRMRNRLVTVFRMYLGSHSASPVYTDFALSRFLKASKIVEDIADFIFRNVLMFAKLHPQLATSDSVFLQVFSANNAAMALGCNSSYSDKNHPETFGNATQESLPTTTFLQNSYMM